MLSTEDQPTNQEILEAINGFATSTEKQFQGLESTVSSLDTKVDSLNKRVGHLENQMVTKDYLDEKLSDLRGDLVVLVRKEDQKVAKLVDILKGKNILDDSDVQLILSLEPFAQLK